MRSRAPLLFCLGAAAATAGRELKAQTWRTITSARQLHGESALAVRVSYAAGRFRLAPAPAGTLYRMEMRYDEERYIPLRAYDPERGTLRLGVRSRGGRGAKVSLGDRRRMGRGDRRRSEMRSDMEVLLSPEIPLELDMELGAVEAEVDLGGLALRSVQYRTGASETRLSFSRPNPLECDELRLKVGAADFRALGIGNANCRRIGFDGGVGDVTLDFSGAWRGSAEAEVNVAIGSVKLRFPRDLGVSIRLNRFVASFDRSGFTRRGDAYYSDTYARATHRLALTIKAAIGSIEVEWVDGGGPR